MFTILILIQIALVVGYPQHELENVYFTSSNSTLQCPTWYVPTSSGCVCGSSLGPLIKCYGHEQVKLRVTYCMGFDEDSQQVLVGNCPYGSSDARLTPYIEQSKNVSHLNEDLCSWANRTGFLCSRCKDGLGMSIMTYSYTCLKCIGKTKGWILYLFLALMPSTVFFLIIVVGRVRMNTEKWNTLICISQLLMFYLDNYPNTVKGMEEKRIYIFILAAVTFAGIWNLDFFRYIIPPFCISEHLSTINIVAMEYIVAIYPMFLLLLTYILIELHGRDIKIFRLLWVPFKWCLLKIPWKIDIRNSIIDGFASILQLSYSKLIFVSFNLLAYVHKLNVKGEIIPPKVWYYDSEILYLSRRHIPYFLLAITVLSVFVIFPMLLIFVYPTKAFQKFLGLFPGINWLPLHAFADAFNGCYKNGTNGTKDYRFFGAFYFFLRLFFYLPMVVSSFKSEVMVTLIPFLGALLLGFLRPYKNDVYNKINTLYWFLFLFSLILTVYNLYSFHIPFDVMVLFLVLPLMHMIGLVIFELLSICFPTLLQKLRSHLAEVIISNSEQTEASSQQHIQSDSHTNQEYLEDSNESEPDRLVNPEKYRLLQPCSVEYPSYGTRTR